MTMKKMWVWMLLTLFTLVGEWHGTCYGFLEEERIGLLEIKSSIDPNGFSLIDWVDTSNESISNCCEWGGVWCDNTTRRVIELDLSGVRDVSLGDLVLNASLFLPFKELRSLALGNNAIVGCHENQGLCYHSTVCRNLFGLKIKSAGVYVGDKCWITEPSSALESSFTLEEVKAAIWECDSSKAPGPDGIDFFFLKKAWETIGDDIYEEFSMEKELCQGDFLSPFLFNMAA
ncbi:hypothetical protein DKX38_006998 [Salix brachista]|uniref:Leucine-rich repeat-containing N-terminal plant-type domain-containing protein n=1 Tax=Salix brachista TaxID=2182728 RepID=A0A5N5MLZ7_9ROSI|nr:hypothetical protein DKX38_006998 [Salix brachista]